MKKFIIFIVFFILLYSTSNIFAQTGVQTRNPLHPLHVDGAKDNSATPTVAQILNDVIFTISGRLGVGLYDPKTRVDVRSADQKGILGLGTNTQTAPAAGGGALRYGGSGNVLQYSDGVAWHTIPVVLPPKALVLANKSAAQSLAQNSDTQFITGWDEKEDAQNNFDPSLGTFIAPRDGFYIVSFNITLASAVIANNTRIETIIESNNSTDNIGIFRNVNSYPAWAVGTQNNIVAGNCNAIFNLKAGHSIRLRVWHNLGSARSVDGTNSGSNNSISIYEL